MALPGGPSGRNPKIQKIYAVEMETRDPNKCNFCELGSQRVIGYFATHAVIENLYPYELFDDMIVEDHLLIVPRRHIVGINEFTDEERTDFLDTVSEFEEEGYTLFARAPQNKAKSVVHQHSHLVKPDMSHDPIQSLLYNRAPHVVKYT